MESAGLKLVVFTMESIPPEAAVLDVQPCPAKKTCAVDEQVPAVA